ncbi:MAG: PAS domain S-box protein [Bacillota bacterium]
MSRYMSEEELRRQAEKQLRRGKQKQTAPVTPEELQRLVQELEVHQIELQMQNEELEKARLELESYLQQYTDLYDFAPVGYLTLDQNGVILGVNLTGARMLGIDRGQLLNLHFEKFILVEYRSSFLSFLEKAFFSRAHETTEIALQKEGNEGLFVHLEALASTNEGECRVALVDISAQKKAEIKLRESEHQYRTLFETMSQGIVYQDSDSKILAANPAAEKILGMPIKQMLGEKPKDLQWEAIHENGTDFPEEIHPSMVALRTGEVVENVIMGFYSPQNGKYSWLSVTAVPQFRPGEDRPFQVFVTFEDITPLKLMENFNELTPREKEVFKLLVKSYDRKTIAEKLKVSPKTVDKHKENLMEKLKLYNQHDLVEFAKRLNLL